MAKVYTAVQAFYAEFDISGDGNSFEPSREQEVLESRPFNSAFVKKDAGIVNDSATLGGYLSFEDPGTAFMSNIGTKVPVSVCVDANPAAEQDKAYLVYGLHAFPGGPAEQGALRTFNLNLDADDYMGIGRVLGNGQKTATGNTAAGWSGGAVPAGGSIVAAVHCTTATTGTVDIIIQSAATGDSGFASPTTRLTFTQITTTDISEWQRATSAAGITDTLWRAKWTGASTPDHTFCVTFAIV